jgi:hypothetical protein
VLAAWPAAAAPGREKNFLAAAAAPTAPEEGLVGYNILLSGELLEFQRESLQPARSCYIGLFSPHIFCLPTFGSENVEKATSWRNDELSPLPTLGEKSRRFQFPVCENESSVSPLRHPFPRQRMRNERTAQTSMHYLTNTSGLFTSLYTHLAQDSPSKISLHII